MFVSRVKQEREGRFVLGTGICMDLTVEKEEAVTEELRSAPAQAQALPEQQKWGLWHHIFNAGWAVHTRPLLSVPGSCLVA